MFSRTIIINLERRLDRKLHMQSWVPQAWHPSFLDKVWDASQLTRLPPEVKSLFPWEIKSENAWWSRPLKIGEVACGLSHHECWKIAASETDPTFILEDDTFGRGDFEMQTQRRMTDLNALDPWWDLVYFGRVSMAVDLAFCCEGIFRPGYSHCTYAYAISKNGAMKLLESEYLSHMMPVDEFLPALFCEHPRSDVRAIVRPILRAYAFQPEIIGQLEKMKWGSDTEESSNVF